MFDPFSGVICEFVVVVVVRVADEFIVVVGEFVVVGKFAVVVSTVENTIFGGDTFSRRLVITSGFNRFLSNIMSRFATTIRWFTKSD